MSGPAPQITVLTAVHNGADFLREAVESIRAQTFEDWEYILVDDASTDDTPELLSRLAREDERFRVIRRQDCHGPYVAANDGLRIARGRWIARLDADDLATRDRFELQTAYLEAHPELRACAGGWQGIDEAGNVVYRPTLPTRPRALKWYLCLRWTPAHSSAFVERRALEEIGGYRPLPRSQDLRLWCDLSRRNWVGMVPQIVTYRRDRVGRLSAVDRPRQDRLALEALADHLGDLVPDSRVPPEQAVAMFRLGGNSNLRVGLRRGLMLLSLWKSWWSQDPDLDEGDRRELNELWSKVRSAHVRAWARQNPLAFRLTRGRWARRAAARVDSKGAQL